MTSLPNKTMEVREPVTDAINNGTNAPTLTSINITSTAKSTAPMGAPNIAETAPVVPQPINQVSFLGLRSLKITVFDPISDPLSTKRASTPTDPPTPTVIADVPARLYKCILGIILPFLEILSNRS